ncbi:MAG: hypothetical protein ACI81V_001362 [Lentimonas sp.]|jgi:hypothetical protein
MASPHSCTQLNSYMNLNSISIIFFSVLLALGISGCGGNGIRITESKNNFASTTGGQPTSAISAASLVHVNEQDRLVTIRNGRNLDAGFLIAKDGSGRQTGILKLRQPRAFGLRTADILQGNPAINNTIETVNAVESARLQQMYPSPDSE